MEQTPLKDKSHIGFRQISSVSYYNVTKLCTIYTTHKLQANQTRSIVVSYKAFNTAI